MPGDPGVYLRRSFYRQTLHRCSSRCFISFGAIFTHRQVIVEDDVYIGVYALIGSVRLGRGCLIGSRASLLSGSQLHELREDGTWTPADLSKLKQIDIGNNTWIGEGAIVSADIGPGAMIATGSVVTSAVPAQVMVAGNPARFVRKLAALHEPVPSETVAVGAPS